MRSVLIGKSVKLCSSEGNRISDRAVKSTAMRSYIKISLLAPHHGGKTADKDVKGSL